MTAARPTPPFDNWRALVAHRPHANVDAIMLQFERIGIAATHRWPDLGTVEDLMAFNVLLFDADMGFDAQFPWEPGNAPIPTIALIGSEAPGRVSWALNQGADAHLLKPIGSAGLYSALVIARHAHARRRALNNEIADLRIRQSSREVMAEATALLMLRDGISARTAFNQIRRLAMANRQTIEQVAGAIVEAEDARRIHR
ncbi:MAG: ANTAR domain-containing protein [Rhodospirillaceae bacterium]|nr:ANTAR domain-containing protein [Rhodospirillaceae bacterium]